MTDVGLIVLGTGSIGSTLLKTLEGNPIFANKSWKILAKADSKYITLMEKGSTRSSTELSAVLFDLRGSMDKIIIIDCTASDLIPLSYVTWLENGFYVVTANKKGLAASQNLFNAVTKFHFTFAWESTVGAGLPIIRVLRNFMDTGDIVRRVEALLSGTLAFIFNSFMPLAGNGVSFNEAIDQARSNGYTEPDPCEDLSGTDVARKLIILARMLGLKLEDNSTIARSLLSDNEPKENRINELCSRMERAKQIASGHNTFLRFVANIYPADGVVEAKLEELRESSPLIAAQGCDNIVCFYTERYPNGFVLKGAGAGADSTVHGLLSDLCSFQ